MRQLSNLNCAWLPRCVTRTDLGYISLNMLKCDIDQIRQY